MPVLDAAVAFTLGGDPHAASRAGGPFSEDRASDASNVLSALGS